MFASRSWRYMLKVSGRLTTSKERLMGLVISIFMKNWDVGSSVVPIVTHPLTVAATGYPPSVNSLGMSKEAW